MKEKVFNKEKPIFIFSELGYKLQNLAFLLMVFVLLIIRMGFIKTDTISLLDKLVLFGLPALGILSVLVLYIDYLFRKEISIIAKFSRTSRIPALLLCFLSFLMALLDIRYGHIPFLLIPGMVVLGSMFWDKTRILVISVLAAAFFVLGFGKTFGYSLYSDNLVVLGLAVITSVYVARFVRLNLLSNESQLKKLEKENTELWNLSFKDGLTGIYNRRYMDQAALHLFARAIRYKEKLHVLMLDIDHFKSVNDKLGHAVGDSVLRAVAQNINSAIRNTDVVARYGGEEFIVFMVRSDPESIQHVANRIRDAVANTRFENVPWQLTISIGIAGLQEGDTLQAMVERADHYLYVSKQKGRNRVSGF